MILEDDSATPLIWPIDAGPNIGGLAVTQWAPGAIRPTIELIPASIRSRVEIPIQYVGRSTRQKPTVVLGSTATRELAMSVVGESGVLTSFGGIYLGYGKMLVVQGSSAPNINTTLLHEYGHYVDAVWTHVDGVQRAGWHLYSNRALLIPYLEIASSIPSYLYGATNDQEWWAELFASQIHPPYTGGGGAGSARLYSMLTGEDPDVGGQIRAELLRLFPDLPRFNWHNPSIAAGPTITGFRLGNEIGDLTTGVAVSQAVMNEIIASSTTWSILSGTLPAGLTTSTSPDTQTLSFGGSPTTPVTSYEFVLRAVNAAGTIDRRFRGRVFNGAIAKPVITTATELPMAYFNEPYSTTLAASGAGPFAWRAPVSSERPLSGLAVGADGVLSTGSGNVAGSNSQRFTLEVMNAGGRTEKSFVLPVRSKGGFYAGQYAELPEIRFGQAFSSQLINLMGRDQWSDPDSPSTITRIPVYASVTAGALPAGVQIDPNLAPLSGLFRYTGTPTVPGPYSFDVTVSNEYGSTLNTGPQTRRGTVTVSGIVKAPADTIWQGFYSRAAAFGDPSPSTATTDTSRGFTDLDTWFAEVFAVRQATNLPAGETSWGGENATHRRPSQIHRLCGGDDALYSEVMAALTALVPSLGRPSPFETSFTGWGGQTRSMTPTPFSAYGLFGGTLAGTCSHLIESDGRIWTRFTRTATGATRMIDVRVGTSLQPSTTYRFRARIRASVASGNITVGTRPDVSQNVNPVAQVVPNIPAGESTIDVVVTTSAATSSSHAGFTITNSLTAVGSTFDIREIQIDVV